MAGIIGTGNRYSLPYFASTGTDLTQSPNLQFFPAVPAFAITGRLTTIRNTGTDHLAYLSQHHNSSASSGLTLSRSRGTPSAQTKVNQLDSLGKIRWWGYDGGSMREAASVDTIIENTRAVTTASLNSRILFSTRNGSTLSVVGHFDSTGTLAVNKISNLTTSSDLIIRSSTRLDLGKTDKIKVYPQDNYYASGAVQGSGSLAASWFLTSMTGSDFDSPRPSGSGLGFKQISWYDIPDTNGPSGPSRISIGRNAGQSSTTTGGLSVAIGFSAGQSTQGIYSVAIGPYASTTTQGDFCVSLGSNAGSISQQTRAIAVGHLSGRISQGTRGIAIGSGAAEYNQGSTSTAIGRSAGYRNQGIQSVAIGHSAGAFEQGNNSIAIGAFAAQNTQTANSIVLNATGNILDAQNSSLYVSPIRNSYADNALFYNTSTKEVTHAPISTFGNIAGVPASSTSTGTLGDISLDGSYFYLCVDTNSWVRFARVPF